MRDAEQIIKAALLAATAHAGQVRKGIDEPYILHPMRVAKLAEECGLSPDAIAAAYLHDVLEDTTVKLDALISSGFHGQTLALVQVLTKWWSDEFVLTSDGLKRAPRAAEMHGRIETEFKPAYYAKIINEPEAVDLKLLDRTDNLHDAVKALGRERRWVERYLAKTHAELGPVLHACNNVRVVARFNEAIWALDKALTVASMADSLRPHAEPGDGPQST